MEIGGNRRKLTHSKRAAIRENVNKCGQNGIGALFSGRIHNPKVGGSIPPPATNKINHLQRPAGLAVDRFA